MRYTIALAAILFGSLCQAANPALKLNIGDGGVITSIKPAIKDGTAFEFEMLSDGSLRLNWVDGTTFKHAVYRKQADIVITSGADPSPAPMPEPTPLPPPTPEPGPKPVPTPPVDPSPAPKPPGLLPNVMLIINSDGSCPACNMLNLNGVLNALNRDPTIRFQKLEWNTKEAQAAYGDSRLTPRWLITLQDGTQRKLHGYMTAEEVHQWLGGGK